MGRSDGGDLRLGESLSADGYADDVWCCLLILAD